MNEPERRQHARRADDANWPDLSTRVTALETRMEVVEFEVKNTNREIAANTALTEEIHGQTSEMWEIFDTAKMGFRFMGKVGSAGMWFVERGGKLCMGILAIAGCTYAAILWVKTGHFTLPDWAVFK